MVRRSTTSACVHCYVLLSVPCVLFPLLCFVAVPLGYIVRCPSLNVLDLLAILVPVLSFCVPSCIFRRMVSAGIFIYFCFLNFRFLAYHFNIVDSCKWPWIG